MVRCVVGLCRELQPSTVIEGVETSTVARWRLSRGQRQGKLLGPSSLGPWKTLSQPTTVREESGSCTRTP